MSNSTLNGIEPFLATFIDVNSDVEKTNINNIFHGSSVTSVLSNALNTSLSLVMKTEAPNDFKNSINNNFRIFQYFSADQYTNVVAIYNIIDKGIKLINLSSGSIISSYSGGTGNNLRNTKGQSYDEVVERIDPLAHSTGKELKKNKVLLVHASGNNAWGIAGGLALLPDTLTVGGASAEYNIYSASTNPSFIYSSASFISTNDGSKEAETIQNGTSFAAPQATAAAAMMMAINPKLTADEILKFVILSAEKSGQLKNILYDIKTDNCMRPTAGILDALGAVNIAISSIEKKQAIKNENFAEKSSCHIF